MLSPKKVKYRKIQKGRVRGAENRVAWNWPLAISA